MFIKTISKNRVFVISFVFLCLMVSGCSLAPSSKTDGTLEKGNSFSTRFEKPRVLGTIKSKEITESSGLVASRCNKDAFWTHNDSGNGAFIYALDKTGRKLGTWRVAGAKNTDWEDIATTRSADGKCVLFIGDIGNNSRLRKEIKIIRVEEPKIDVTDSGSSKKSARRTAKAETIRAVYPAVRHDAEALLVHPETEELYILSKRYSGASGVYKLPRNYKKNEINTLKKVGDVSLPAFPNGSVTGGEISSDGRRVILCDYFNGYELELPERAKTFDEIWKDEPAIIKLGRREQGESICYSLDVRSVFATSEKRNSPLIEVKRK